MKNAKSMKWHPLFIKWCLYLRHLSGKSYELLRESGCIKLPSQRTLRDCSHYILTTSGFSAANDQQFESSIDTTIEINRYIVCVIHFNINNVVINIRYVSLIMDEMYVKDDLVYDKHAGTLIGFVNLGETNNHLTHFEKLVVTHLKPLLIPCLFFGLRSFFKSCLPLCSFPL
jgi:hypothetical protein